MVEKVDRSGKNAISVCQQYMIRRYQNILEHMKTWCNSKIFRDFVEFSSVMFWAQNVLIPPDQNLSIILDQNVPILLVISTSNGNIHAFWQRKLCMKT